MGHGHDDWKEAMERELESVSLFSRAREKRLSEVNGKVDANGDVRLDLWLKATLKSQDRISMKLSVL